MALKNYSLAGERSPVVHAAAERRRRRFFCHAAAAEKNERRDSAYTVFFEYPTETNKFLKFDHKRYKVS